MPEEKLCFYYFIDCVFSNKCLGAFLKFMLKGGVPIERRVLI